MPRQKTFSINLTEDQINKFKDALHRGAPLMVALSYARITPAKYFYYVEVANISAYFREMENVKEEEAMLKSGIQMSQVRESADNFSKDSKSIGALHQYRVPTAESILRYRNNKSFKAFCDEVYDLLMDCDMKRAEIALYHLEQVRKASESKRINGAPSQWFLERTLPDYFGRVEKTKFEGSLDSRTTFADNDGEALPPLKVQFVDPNTKENRDRVKDMEDLVLNQLNGKEA